jgi:hypothetical protein
MSESIDKLEREVRLMDRAETATSTIHVLAILAANASPTDAAILVKAGEDIIGLGAERRRGNQGTVAARLARVVASVRSK